MKSIAANIAGESTDGGNTADGNTAGEGTAGEHAGLQPGVCSMTMPCGGELACHNQMTLIVRNDVFQNPWVLCEIVYYQ